MADWETIKIPREMAKHMESMAKSKYGHTLGFTSKSQIAVTALREFLKQYSDFLTYLELIDISDNIVIIRDHKLGKNIKLVIKNGKITCDKDKESSCKHIEFALIIPRVQKQLQ